MSSLPIPSGNPYRLNSRTNRFPSTLRRQREQKVRLTEALVDAGIRRVEATSCVSPKWIPNLADAGEVLAGVRRQPGVTYAALVPNLKDLERALVAKVDETVIFLSASEAHSRKNINTSVAEALVGYVANAGPMNHAGCQTTCG